MLDTGNRVFEVTLLPARHGDAILLKYGHADRPHFVLIDGGPRAAFEDVARELRSRLGSPAVLRLLVITHIDNDHIDGAALLAAGRQLDVVIDDIWFNGWPQLQGNLLPVVAPAPSDGELRGASEAEVLEIALEQYKGRWNRHFSGEAIRTDSSTRLPEISIQGGLKLTLLSPRGADLQSLKRTWEKAIEKLGVSAGDKDAIRERLASHALMRGDARAEVVSDDAAAAMTVAHRLDKAVANRSSIAFIAEFCRKKCLLLGDAQMQVVEESLERWCGERDLDKMEVHAVKMSHHGSLGNLTPSFLRSVMSGHFLISTDGSKSKHPDPKAIEMIINAVSAPCLHFNYLTPRTAAWAGTVKPSSRPYEARYPRPGESGVTIDLLNL